MGATLVDTGGMPLQPPRRQPNAKGREREYLTDGEIARLIAVAGENRHSHRDGTMVLVALNGTRVIAHRHDSIVQAVITGLAHHAVALFIGYAVCLVTLVLRQRASR